MNCIRITVIKTSLYAKWQITMRLLRTLELYRFYYNINIFVVLLVVILPNRIIVQTHQKT